MNIGIDIMGGDFAPNSTIKGVILARAVLSSDKNIVLFGDKNLITSKIEEFNGKVSDFTIVDCSQTIEMEDDPIKSFIEKTDSSIVKGFMYLKQGLIDGFASAGNTGAMLVGVTKVVGLIEGVYRPCISSHYPNDAGKNNLLLDVGINSDAKPENLHQNAYLGSIYAKYVLGIEKPRVGLLNIGEEKSKGSPLAKSSYQLLSSDENLNFVGNIEGNDLYKTSKADVIVTDGFTGNVLIKQAESFYDLLVERGINDSYFKGYNYETIGGTAIIGASLPTIVGHGISTDVAIKNMTLFTKDIIESQFCNKIIEGMQDFVSA